MAMKEFLILLLFSSFLQGIQKMLLARYYAALNILASSFLYFFFLAKRTDVENSRANDHHLPRIKLTIDHQT